MNELQKIVNEVQYRTGKTIKQVAESIEYKGPYFNDQINKGDNDGIKELLIKKYRKVLVDYFSSDPGFVMNEPEAEYGLKNDERIIEMLASKQRTIEILVMQVEVMQKRITDLESVRGNVRRSG